MYYSANEIVRCNVLAHAGQLPSLISMPKRKMTDFFTAGSNTGSVTPSRPTGTGSVPAVTSVTVDVEIHVDAEETPFDPDEIEVVQDTAPAVTGIAIAQETAPPEIEVPVEAAPPVVQETAQETSATKKPKFDHQFQEKWRAKWAWLVKNDDGIGMTCDICSKCDKSNSFTTGCTNFRTSTIERHVITHDHQEAVKAQTMQRGFLQASLDNLPNVMYNIIEHATDKKKKKLINHISLLYSKYNSNM